MNKVLFALALSLILLVSGCSSSKYYEFEEGVFCLDVDKNKVCDEDEETEDEIVDEETEESSLDGNVVNNSSTISESDKTEHGTCLESYDIEPGTVVHRYATWDPFRDDSSADKIEEVGYFVYKDRIGVDAKETYDA